MNSFRVLSNFDILDVAQSLGIDDLIFVGTQDMLNSVPKAKRKNKFYIINLDRQIQNGGTGLGNHWVMLSTHEQQPFYFDSFGLPPPTRVYKFHVKVNTNDLAYFNIQVQSPLSEICGWYCLMICDMLNRIYKDSQSFPQFLNQFKRLGFNFGNEKRNFRIVLKYFSNVLK